MTVVIHSRDELAATRARLSGPVGLVPTMGALHAGHLALMERARECATVMTTVFVNPTQFAANEDLSRYPRTLGADVALAEQAGVDVVWAPAVDDVYPGGDPQVTVTPGPLGAVLEGQVRPTHFAGVLTVVAKLFGLIRPDRAYFGEKDYQQLVLIRRMAADLELGVDVIGVPTVRESDGLALSSRNVYLSADDRRRAVALSRALRAGQVAAPDVDAVLDRARAELAAAGVEADYLELRGADLGPVRPGTPARLVVAAKIGTTRLIDNVVVKL